MLAAARHALSVRIPASPVASGRRSRSPISFNGVLPPLVYPTRLQPTVSTASTTSNRSTPESVLSPRVHYKRLRGIVVEIEGNIASGKSTLTRMIRDYMNDGEVPCLKEFPTMTVFGEQVNQDFLGKFYTQKAKYGFAFQMYMLTTRLYQMQEAARQAKQENRLVLLDRGAVGDSLFAIMNHQAKDIDDEEFHVYKSVCRERMPRSISDEVDVVLYLDVDPSICHHRLVEVRKHDAEAGVPLAYLEKVDETYFHLMVDWISKRSGTYYDMNIGTIPPFAVMRWDHYGEVDDALRVLDALRRGTRSQPTIQFVDPPLNGDVALDTTSDMATMYAMIRDDKVPSDLNKVMYVNWSLPHDNAYRRVVMYLLSMCICIHMYETESTYDV